MGALRQFDLGTILRRWPCPVFIETGTGLGASLAYAQQFPFRTLYSIEADPVLAEAARVRTREDMRVMIREGDTTVCLPPILQVLDDQDVPPPVCCWLDAHYPAELPVTELPLVRELELLAGYGGFRRSVVLIDDLRIYEPGGYQAGNLPAECRRGDPDALRRFEKRVIETHYAERSIYSEGTLAFFPREVA